MQRFNNRTVLVIAVTVCAIAASFMYSSIRRAEIQRDQAVQEATIEREREVEVQAQKTERTEERSQFWQELVPWGEDEAEKGN